MKQSLKAYQPVINNLILLEKFVSLQKGSIQLKGIAFCGEGLKEPIGKVFSQNTDSLILIGPEGDFTHEEVEMCISAGFKGVSLGKSRLRTETAGVVACHGIAFINNS